MPTSDYRTKDGKRVPGTTTIIGRFKESGGLIHWAWQVGRDGKDYRDMRDKAADSGTLAHAMIEDHLHGRPVNGTEDDKARSCFEAFLEWEHGQRLKIMYSEEALVSEAHRYGGTPDHIGTVAEKYSLIDIKTSNNIYPDYIVQLGAYMNLWEEAGNPAFERFHLLRVGKESASFHHHMWQRSDIVKGWEAFKLMRSLYDVMRDVKKLV